MRGRLNSVLVVVLIVCILAIVISPFVDLPLTSLRSYSAAVFFHQVVLLLVCTFALLHSTTTLPRFGRQWSEGPPPTQSSKPQLIDLTCSYLC